MQFRHRSPKPHGYSYPYPEFLQAVYRAIATVKFGEMTYEEIARAADAGAIAVLPTGCTEQQGPHLTVDSDTWFAEELAVEAAERVVPESPVVVLPAVPFGPAPEHRGYGSGFVDIPVSVYDEFLRAILDSLADQGFTRILVWRGCGGHDLRQVVSDFNQRRNQVARAFLPAHPFHAIWCSIADPSVPGGHADSFTTSIVMRRRPEALRPERIPAETSAEPDWSDPALDFSRYSSTGVVGTAVHASPELGERLWEASVQAVVDALCRIMQAPARLASSPPT